MSQVRLNQSGFTLVELSIVVAIIGLLVSAIAMLGPRLIEQSRSKELLKRVIDYRAEALEFNSRFRFLPGDLPATTNDFSAISTGCAVGGAGGGNGDGLLSAAESGCADEHLVLAGFTNRVPLQGGITVQLASYGAAVAAFTAVAGSAPAAALPARVRNVVVVQNVPCYQAIAVDQGLDDGNLATGNSVVSLSPACAGSVPVWLVIAL